MELSVEAPPTAIASKKSIMRPSNPAILSTTSNRPNEHGKVVSAIQVRNGSDDLNLAHVGALEDSLMATLDYLFGTPKDAGIANLLQLHVNIFVITSMSRSNWIRGRNLGCWFDHFRVDELSCHFQFVHCRIADADNRNHFLATFIYGSPNYRLRGSPWSHLKSLASTIHEPWVILGDFNATLSPHDRKGCSSSTPDSDFQQMVFNCGLHDLGFLGPEFTWYRASSITHLLRVKSDHRPLLLTTHAPSVNTAPRPFRYLSGWALHHDFKHLVSDNWDSSITLSEAIAKFSEAAQLWNKEVFGVIGKNKKILMARLRGVHRCLDQHRTQNGTWCDVANTLRDAAANFLSISLRTMTPY
ncbi:hypothetical protein V6N13_125551 [Hibiscus sabdariffa]